MLLDDSFNVYEDIEVPAGCDLIWGFQLEPLNASGAIASFYLSNPAQTGFVAYPLAITLTSDGTDAISSFAVDIPGATMAAYSQGLYSYYMRIEYANSSVGPLGYGQVIVGP